MGRFLSLLIGLFLLIAILGAAPAPISVTATPRVGIAPLFVRARITIEPDEENRRVCLAVIDQLGPIQTSCWTLNGLSSPRTTIHEFKDLEQGDFDIIATVERSSGNKSSVPLHVQVMGRF